MAYPSRLSSGEHTATPPSALTAQDSDERSANADLGLARMTRANVLLVGPERQVERIVSVHLPEANAGLVIRCQDGLPRLPPASSQGVMLLRDVDFLTPQEQRRLLEWLDAPGNRIQVVSTAATHPLLLVAAGAFNEALYYRLNTVYIDLSE